MSLYEKIYNVMTESEGLEKDLIVGKGDNAYKAVGEKEVLNMLKPLFKKHKLIIFPVDGEISESNSIWESESYGKKETKARHITQLKVKFKIVDIETSESEILIGFGNGADSQDKGSGKSFTYAFKTMLSKTFMLFSGEDTDNTHSDDISKGVPATKKAPPAEELKPSTRSQALYNIATSKGITIASVVSSVRKNFNKSMDEMTADEYEKVRSTYDSMLPKITAAQANGKNSSEYIGAKT